MANLTVGDMLDRAQTFESRLEEFYAAVRDAARSDGVRLLTHYLSRHRNHLPTALQALSPGAEHRIRLGTLKYDDTEFRPDRDFDGLDISPDVKSDEFLDTAIALVERLTSFYRWLGRQPLGSDASALVQSLLKIEETHVVELKKTKAMDYF
jgi:hypothetical protein